MDRKRVERARAKARAFLIHKEGAAIMRKAGTHPALIYAWEKTGLLVGEDSPHTAEERQEWMDAVNEWYAKHGEESDEPQSR